MTKQLTGDVFAHEMTKTSKIFSRDGKLNVMLGGSEAGTDGHTVILPGVDPNAEIEEYEARVLRGYVDHEAAHQRHTDIKGGWIKKAEDRNPYLGQLMQALEDVRVESRAVDEYAGARTNLQATCEATVREVNKIIEDDGTPDEKMLVPLAISMSGRDQHLNYSIPALDDFRQHVSQETWDKAVAWAKRAIDAKTTEEVYNLALEIEPEIIEKPPQQEQPGPQGQGAQGQNGDKSDHGRSHQTDEDGDNGMDGKFSPDLDKGVNATAEDIGLAQTDDMAVFDRRFDTVLVFDGNIKKFRLGRDLYELNVNTQNILAPAGTVVDTAINGRLTRMGRAEQSNIYMEDGHIPQLVSQYEGVKAGISASIHAVKSAFERYFISKMNRGWDTGKLDGRLDPKRLASVMAGADNVFRQREDIDEMDTCVAITVDCSGSMSGTTMTLAKQVLIAMGEALEKMRIPYYVQGHTGRSQYIEGDMPDGTSAYHYYAPPTTIYNVKPFNTRLADARAGIARMNAGGGTPEGSGLSYLIDAVRFRPEKRKILIVLTDGSPNGGAEENLLIQQIKTLKKDRNVSLFAVGIATDEPKRYYGKDTVVIYTADDLARTMFAQVKAAMDKKVAA